MTEHDDALWNPTHDGDPGIRRLETLLAPYCAEARLPREWTRQPVAPPRRFRRIARALAAGLAASLLLYAGHAYRLAWSDGAPWRVTNPVDRGVSAIVAPGGLLETGTQESLRIAVARIGEITLSPDSMLQLVETRAGKHRVDLQHGHLRARIWAPPGYFGVADDRSEVIDLGCDFDLWKQPDGSGRVYVRSGWVAYRVAAHEVLVPAGYAMQFDAEHPSTPLRPEADIAFVQAVQVLERALATPETSPRETRAASDAVARVAQDADAFTLLALLSDYPRLADGDLYPRLAQALKTTQNDTEHRAAWIAGRRTAVDAWWALLPIQPKHWWANWVDVF